MYATANSAGKPWRRWSSRRSLVSITASHRVGGRFRQFIDGASGMAPRRCWLAVCWVLSVFPLQPGADIEEIRQRHFFVLERLKSVGGQQVLGFDLGQQPTIVG